jgi:hypothetical protein
MKPMYSWTGMALLALGLVLTGCSETSSRTDAGQNADATQADGDAGVDGDATPADGDAGDTPDETTVALKVEQIIPSRGPASGGIWVNIKGSGFVEGIQHSPFGIEVVTEVVFGDNPSIDIEVIRDDLISVATPAGIAGPVDVTVENPNGRVTLDDGFSYYENVTALRVNPLDFSCGGGTPFSIEGTGFTPDTTVIVDGRPASTIVVESDTKVHAVAPPGSPGPKNVEVINRNGRALLFRAITYHPVPDLTAVEPAAGPEAGGTAVMAGGAGFDESVKLMFGGAPATGLLCPAPDSLQAVTPAGLGTVDVTVVGRLDSSTLAGGFIFLPDPTGSLTVTGVAPAAGPVAGGGRVTVAGEGFAAGVDQVLFGSNPSSDVQVADDRRLTAAVPAGAVGTVPVTVSTATDQAGLPDAYRYFQPIGIDGIDPTTGAMEGGTAFSIQGSGFHQAIEIRFDGVPARSLSVTSDTVVTGVTPPGSPGPADVRVKDADSQSILLGAFEYTTDLALTRIHPDYGAQAGGTYVVCHGNGFGQNPRLWFGDQEAGDVQVSSPSIITARTPPGNPGYVPVTIELDGGKTFELVEGFYYYDPTNDQGGASGGPIRGSFNVTVLNGDRALYGQPIPGAIVVIEDPPIAGTTDESGQVTFSGPKFVRAVMVTAAKEEFGSVTVANLNATNLTVFLPPSSSSSELSDQPPCVHGSSISGRVFGFKDIPGLPTGPSIVMKAVVYLARKSMFGLPPFSSAPTGLDIEEDGGQFDIGLCWGGNYTIYALYGAFDTITEEFTAALFGMRRGIQLFTDESLTDQDIVLGTYLDQSVSIHLEDPPMAPGDAQTVYRAYAHLDLGRDGAIYFGEDESTGPDMQIDGLPAATSDSFIFVGLAGVRAGVRDSYPFSYTFRRPQGNLSDGVTLGPFLGFTEIDKPTYGEDLSDGLILWSVQDPQPELIEMVIKTYELPPRRVWQIILPGDTTQVTLPPEALALLPKQQPLFLIIYTANSPYFRFDSFNYSQLNTDHWTSYTINYAVFTML